MEAGLMGVHATFVWDLLVTHQLPGLRGYSVDNFGVSISIVG